MGDPKLVLPEMTEVWQQTLDWSPDAQQQHQFQHLYQLTLTGNRQLNLTRITAAEEFWEKHLWDSLRGVAPLLPTHSPQRIIDIGTGGGFPGIPIAIAQPHWTVTLLDSTRKKINFLQTLLLSLGVENALPLCDRAEQVGQNPDHRQTYDMALIRAVGPAPVCAEYALPLVKVGGLAVLYRGQWSDRDTETLERAVAQLGGKIESVARFLTPMSESIRHCLYLRKVAPTPQQFPRAVGIPAQNLLGATAADREISG